MADKTFLAWLWTSTEVFVEMLGTTSQTPDSRLFLSLVADFVTYKFHWYIPGVIDAVVPCAIEKTHSSLVTDPETVKLVPGVPFNVAW